LELQASIGPDYWLAMQGRLPEALAAVDARMALIGDDPALGKRVLGFSLLVYGFGLRAWVLILLGRLAEGRAALERGVALARELDEVEGLGWAEACSGELAYVSGEPGDAVARSRRSVEIAERLGSSHSRAIAYYGLSLAHAAGEEWEDVMAAVEMVQRIAAETGSGRLYMASALGMKAAAHIGLGDAAAAVEAASAGVEIAVAVGAGVEEAACRCQLGRALTVLRPAEARRELERALALSEEARSVLVPHVHAGLAELAAAQGDERERVAQLELAREGFERQGAGGHVRRVDAQLPARVGEEV
jgi:tetratricopeptide (TPR) repeat protein